MADRKSRAPRGDWRNVGQQSQLPLSKNPYAGLNVLSYGENANLQRQLKQQQQQQQQPQQAPLDLDGPPNQFLSVDNIDKAKVHRRFSVRLNGPPQLEFQHQPLPGNAQGMIKREQRGDELQKPVQRQQQQQQQQPSQLQQQLQKQQKQQQHSKYLSVGNIYDDELNLLSKYDFDAIEYIRETLSNATATKIDEFAKSLNKLSIQVDDNIKEVINKSLENLSRTSKDFNETELEIKNLKTIFNELNEIIQNMKETADSRVSQEQASSDHRGKDRSSIFGAQKIWDKQLQSLFNHVAGAQQLITAIPGRHVLTESGRWYEVSPTTMKPLNLVHLFVLNDHFMVLTQRRQHGDSQPGNKSQNLVATQCWPLRDIKLFDLKSINNDLGEYHMIKITYQSSIFVYRTDRYDHYSRLLKFYREAKDVLRTIVENDKTMKQTGTVSRTASQINRRSTNKERRSSGILNKSHQRTRSLEIFTNDTIISMKNLDDNIDELDIQISRKNLGELVVLLKVIENELNKLSNKKIDLQIEEIVQIIDNLKLRLQNRKDMIIDELTKKFYTPSAKNSGIEIKNLINLFSQLNLIDVGRDTFLKSRDSIINNLIDKVEINGIIPDFITQISIIRFQIIKSTIKTFQLCLSRTGDDQSCFLVDWCFNQIRQHVKFLDQQLNGVDTTSINYQDCVRVTKLQVEDLKGIGIDVGFLLDDFYKSVQNNGV